MFLAKLVDAIDYFDADDCSLPIFQVEEMKLILNMIRPYLKRYILKDTTEKNIIHHYPNYKYFPNRYFRTLDVHISIRM